ncbi:MAG: ABC transporter permease [Chloroflexi bacterium]|nr:ABC transporter permease [Chloroflexota bacterium]
MSNLLPISKREITRLRGRFTGRSRLFVIGIFAVAVILSTVIYHQDPVISKSIYNIGVFPNGPHIADERFNVIPLDSLPDAERKLEQKEIGLYIIGDRVRDRPDDRSQYTVGALSQYLERQELLRISDQYDVDQAFPLRIEIHHMAKDSEVEHFDVYSQPSLSDILQEDTESLPSLELDPPALPEPSAPDPESIYTQTEPSIPMDPAPIPGPSQGAPSADPIERASDSAVKEQLKDFINDNGMPEFKAEFASDEEIIIPSLLKPPIPVSQVLIAFFYVVPIFFVSIFFTSSFMEEKTNRKLIILMSAPITPFQIIMGKMLPYIGYSFLAIIAITLALGGNVLLALAIFIPIMLFIFSIYLMVALLYRTFKDQTFFSMMAVWIVTAYLVAPAMFTGVNELSYISPLTLAVLMYRGESFGLSEYLLSTIPMFLVFFVTMLAAVRIFNEEYLMGYRPLYRKLSEAIYLIINKSHLNISMVYMSLLLIPVVFMVQLASIVIVFKLSLGIALGIMFAISIVTEEIVKSAGFIVLLQNRMITSLKSVVVLSFMAALGFWIGEKLLLFLTLRVMSESLFIEALFSSGVFLIFPLVMHFITTCTVCLLTKRWGIKFYPVAIIAGALIHAAYNLFIIRGAL